MKKVALLGRRKKRDVGKESEIGRDIRVKLNIDRR